MHPANDGPKLPRALEDAVDRAVAEALTMYKEGHSVDEATAAETAQDFRRFYIAALSQGCPGIRWNFGGCLLCEVHDGPKRCRRILVFGPRLLRATGGRPMGADVCDAHYDNVASKPGLRTTLEQAALRRLERDPVKTDVRH